MQLTEENLKIENDTFALKREYKYALENLSIVKKDTIDAITIKDKINLEILDKKKDLQDVLNRISEEKVSWAQHRNEELVKLENKNSEADNIIKRKVELNVQEEDIRKLTKKDEDTLNENRRLEFKLEQDKTALQVESNRLKDIESNITQREKKLEKNKIDFKGKVTEVLSQVKEL